MIAKEKSIAEISGLLANLLGSIDDDTVLSTVSAGLVIAPGRRPGLAADEKTSWVRGHGSTPTYTAVMGLHVL